MVSKKELLDRIIELEKNIKQVTESDIEREPYHRYGYYGLFGPLLSDYEKGHDVTLKGEVEAIKKYLNLDIEYIPSKTTKSKIVAKKLNNQEDKNVKKTKKVKK